MERTTQRLFFALEMDVSSKQKLVDCMAFLQSKETTKADLRWTPRDNLHITLRFLGELTSIEAEKYTSIVKQALSDTRSFFIKTAQLIALPSAQHPCLIALGVEKTPGLQTLFDRVNSALVSSGLPQEKYLFTPHITLVKGKHHPEAIAALLKQKVKCGVIEEKIECLTLFRTNCVNGASIYTPLLSIPF
ncbi:MAG: 2-5 ligase [Gammaproteobacteria bacterium]|jgi:2'-5' RNA ligase|nr:2-5 ligase [Gammaproteobacteria bacterium]